MTIFLEKEGDCIFTFDENIEFKFICRIDSSAYQSLFAQEIKKNQFLIPKDVLRDYYGELWIEKYKDIMYNLRELEEAVRKKITPDVWDVMFYSFLNFLIFRENFMDLKEPPEINFVVALDKGKMGDYLKKNAKTMKDATKNIPKA